MNSPADQTRFLTDRQIDLLCDQFEQEWDDGLRPDLATYISRVSEQQQSTLLKSLLPLDAELRRTHGETITVNTYLEQLPGHQQQITELWQQVQAATVSRTGSGETSQLLDDTSIRQGGRDLDTRITSGSDSGASISFVNTGDPDWKPTSDRYDVQRSLGQGAMGTVFLAQDRQLNRSVALKFPRFDKATDSHALSRFQTEAQAAAQLRHPVICPVHDLGDIDGRPFLSMAYIAGQSLQERVKTGQPFEIAQAVELIGKLAAGLEVAHRAGVIHRDLKPANIMIDAAGEPVIMDFGLARIENPVDDTESTREGTVLGSPAYMAPEQAQARLSDIGPASDIYSLGVILFRLLTGRLPFEGSTMETLAQVVLNDAPSPAQFRPDMDPRLEAICLKMVARQIEDRYASMAEVESELAAYVRSPGFSRKGAPAEPPEGGTTSVPPEGATIIMPPEGGTTNVRSTAFRRSVIAAATATAITALLLSVIFFIQTPTGTVRIEYLGDGPTPQISVDGNVIKIDDMGRGLQFTVGEHTLTARIGDRDLEASRRFTINRDAAAVLKVTLVAGELHILAKGERIPVEPPSLVSDKGEETLGGTTLWLPGPADPSLPRPGPPPRPTPRHQTLAGAHGGSRVRHQCPGLESR